MGRATERVSGSEHTRALDELSREDEGRFGGKSASLGELIASEIPVPAGFAVSSSAYRAALADAGLESLISEQLGEHDPDDVAELRAASASIVEALRAAPMPAVVRAEIVRRYEELGASAGEPDPPVAVRSSALGEDSQEATFAGQQETYLWVRGADSVCDSVRDCWASLFSPEAMGYRARIAAAGGAPAMGVTVQRMVDAAVSGVMFTCNPVSGDPSTVVVNATWGLGLAVVGGEVTPDEYRLSKVTGELLHQAISSKELEYAPDPAGGGTKRKQVPAERRQAACLAENELGQLLEVAKRVERHFGGHQDVEWALARQGGELLTLQSRPVTARPAKGGKPTSRKSAIELVMGTFGATGGPPDRS